MIGYLKGKVIAHQNQELWIDVAGVGYRVRTNNKFTNPQMTKGTEVELFIHTAVREDAITLYGFSSLDELQLFELLISVSGVGPKTGMDIIGKADGDQIETAIREADVHFFESMKGIGKKSAQRIIIDLKNKIGSLKEIDLAAEETDDAVYLVLKQFGFKPATIQQAMKQIDRNLSEAEQIKAGLRLLGK